MKRLLLACIAIVGSAGAAASQERERCVLVPFPQTRLTRESTPGGQGNTFIGAGVNVRCPSKELTLRADSLESYGDEGRLYLIGNVRYNEPRLALTSDFLTYFQTDERIVANGNVDATLPNGSRLVGPVAEYYRAVPGMRTVARLTAGGRPTITLLQRDTQPQPQPPVPTTVVANNVLMLGDSLVYAGGQVIVTREDVLARADSMDLDSEREITVLMRNPSISGRRDRPFTLSGQRITLTGESRKLNRVLSIGGARAVSDDLELAADTIDLRVAADLLQRAIAWGPSRARASSESQMMISDSIDVRMPDQRVRELFAVRNAHAEGRPDTVRFRADTVDWMRGDTIIARFDSTLADTAQAQLRQLVATGAARSYHHLAPADSAVNRPAINYVTGREIIVSFEKQRVARVTVLEKASGVYLEPRPLAPRDTTAAPAAGSAPRRPPR